jgi:hypothetical protein
MSEKLFRSKVLKRLREIGGEWILVPVTRYGISGVADIVGCYRGLFVAIELKDPDGSDAKYGLKKHQEAFLYRIKEAGGYSLCTRSLIDIEIVLEKLKDIVRPSPDLWPDEDH